MNSKLCKSLRKLSGGNHATYSSLGSPKTYTTIHGIPFQTAPGTTRTLSTDCSRYLYKKLKQTA